MRSATIAAALLCMMAAPASAQSTPQTQTQPQAPAVESLRPGDAAPAFTLPGSDGKSHTLAEHAGKRAVVIAWFPKAFTGG